MEVDSDVKGLLKALDRFNFRYCWAVLDSDDEEMALCRKKCHEIETQLDKISRLTNGVAI
jgi:hypothetical protein